MALCHKLSSKTYARRKLFYVKLAYVNGYVHFLLVLRPQIQQQVIVLPQLSCLVILFWAKIVMDIQIWLIAQLHCIKVLKKKKAGDLGNSSCRRLSVGECAHFLTPFHFFINCCDPRANFVGWDKSDLLCNSRDARMNRRSVNIGQ